MRISTLKAIAAAAVTAITVTSAASAADLAARPYTKAPVVVEPGYNWTGFYAGLNGGYSWGRANTTVAPFASIFPVVPFSPIRTDVNGGVAGGQIGYNWQVNPSGSWALRQTASGAANVLLLPGIRAE